jgi:hypothetical protein
VADVPNSGVDTGSNLRFCYRSKAPYFHAANIVSVEQSDAGQSCVIDSPLGIFTVSAKNSFHHKPHFRPGPIRVFIEPKANVGDSVNLLDEDDKEYRAIILDRKSRPAPIPTFGHALLRAKRERAA